MQLYLINESIKKYPDNYQGYIDRLSVYKYSDDKKGEDELIKLIDEKFGNKWEANFELAYHFITMDFLWPDSEHFDFCAQHLKKSVELNPSDFNSLLLLSVAYPNESFEYFKKLYQLAPGQFVKSDSENKAKYPYKIISIKSLPLGKDLTVGLDRKTCVMLKLIK